MFRYSIFSYQDDEYALNFFVTMAHLKLGVRKYSIKLYESFTY